MRTIHVLSDTIKNKYFYLANVSWKETLNGRSTILFKTNSLKKKEELQNEVDSLADYELENIVERSNADHVDTEVDLRNIQEIRVVTEHPNQLFLFKEIQDLFSLQLPPDLRCVDLKKELV